MRQLKFIFTGLILLSITFAMVYIGYKSQFGKGFMEVAMLIAGGIFFTSLFTFIFSTATGQKTPLVSIHFNTRLFDEQLKKYDNYIDITPQSHDEFDAINLVGKDNNLALAKLRLEIDKKLSRIGSKLGVSGKGFQSRNIIKELIERGIISGDLEFVWNEVLDNCNKAIHGANVDDQTAFDIVKVGEKLITSLDVNLNSNK